jgi:2-hydroxy-6-oxonona-2,4-dienedioate hydrolase
MHVDNVIKAAAILGVSGGTAAYLRFRRELKAAESRLLAGSTIIETAAGLIEFAREGQGEPVLMIHGAGGGYDQGMFVARDIFESGYDIVAPSRFGYLRTPVPADSSPAAQADAHAALLDQLGIGRALVAGVSAGAPSAIEMALRHPDRVSALILLVPRAFAPDEPVGVDRSATNLAVLKLIEAAADFGFWLMIRFARRAVVRFLGVPPEVEAQASEEERERITALMRSILPLSRRVAGIRLDGETVISEWPLELIRTPTLVISAPDDLFHTLPAARYTAARIPGGQLEVLPSGGHLMVGNSRYVHQLIEVFLRRHAPLRQAA